MESFADRVYVIRGPYLLKNRNYIGYFIIYKKIGSSGLNLKMRQGKILNLLQKSMDGLFHIHHNVRFPKKEEPISRFSHRKPATQLT